MHDNRASKFVDDLSVDLETCMISIESIYGLNVSGDFNHLVTALLRNGLTFECAVEKTCEPIANLGSRLNKMTNGLTFGDGMNETLWANAIVGICHVQSVRS
jgi:hypothetical protein